jgi:hypothetical protein
MVPSGHPDKELECKRIDATFLQAKKRVQDIKNK